MPLEQALAGLLLVATGAVDKEIGWLPDDHHHDDDGDHNDDDDNDGAYDYDADDYDGDDDDDYLDFHTLSWWAC